MLTKRTVGLIVLFGLVIPIGAGILIYYLGRPGKTKEFETLSEISRYAAALNEFPIADDSDWEDPHFGTFIKSRLPGAIGTFRQWLGLWQPPPFSPNYLAKLLREVTKANRAMGLEDGEKSFIHIKSHEPSKLIVFGDVHGSFHSLIRGLEHLREQNIIGDDLSITSPSTYILFNGDFIDRSPYSIDSLILACLLMKKNPKQVFYIAGKHERNGHWLDYGLRRELVARGKYYSDEAVPFHYDVLNFFATLPEAVYVSGSKDQREVIRIAFNDADNLSFNEHLLLPAFVHQNEAMTVRAFEARKEGEEGLDIRAALKTEDWRQESRIEHGLGLLDQEDGATTWAILSSPITVNRIFLGFFDDAFATIEVSERVQDASISLTHQDSRTLLGFATEAPLNIVSARPKNAGKNGKFIKVASSMSLVRGVPNIGQRLKTGLDTLVNEYNRTYGKLESTIRLYVENDDNIPSFARHNVHEAIESGVRFFLLSSGTTTTISYMDLIEKSRSAIFFPATGADELRKPTLKHVIHLRAAYQDEARAMVRTLRKEYGSNKIAIVYRDDAYGRPPFEAAVEELKKLGVKEVVGIPYTHSTTTFNAQAAKIKQNLPDALGFFANAHATKEVIRLIGINELVSTRLFALSVVGETNVRKYLKRKGLNMLFASPVPNPKTSTMPIAAEYRQAMDRERNLYDGLSFEAYVAARLFLRAIEMSKKTEPTPQEIISYLEATKKANFDGLPLNFNPTTRSLATEVWLETSEDDDWIAYPLD